MRFKTGKIGIAAGIAIAVAVASWAVQNRADIVANRNAEALGRISALAFDGKFETAIDGMYRYLQTQKSTAGLQSLDKKAFADVDKRTLNNAMAAATDAYLPARSVMESGLVFVERGGFGDGLSVTVLKDGAGTFYIAYRGSDDVRDVQSDLQIINGDLPDQFATAQSVYEDFRQRYPDAKIVLTGHSLGASLAQLVAAKNPETAAYTCAPVGTGNIVKREKELSDTGNVYNLLVKGDAFSNALAQTGRSKLVEIKTANGRKQQPHSVLNCQGR